MLLYSLPSLSVYKRKTRLDHYHFYIPSSLIIRGLELPHPQYKVAMVTGYALSLVSEWLESGECLAGKRELSLSSTEELMALVKTFLASKMTVYGLTNAQLDHISSLLLQARWNSSFSKCSCAL